VHPTFANVRVIPTSVGIHTEAIDLDFRLHGNDRSTKLQNEVFAISGCTRQRCTNASQIQRVPQQPQMMYANDK
jgi:hypothetical protein